MSLSQAVEDRELLGTTADRSILAVRDMGPPRPYDESRRLGNHSLQMARLYEALRNRKKGRPACRPPHVETSDPF
ncbi:MAG: hypothetical protein R3293_14930 [Candidatus Promineifilaceae bacterium]|nr:hypothetical protein [Candidatus Promineifilaceae bacterium]